MTHFWNPGLGYWSPYYKIEIWLKTLNPHVALANGTWLMTKAMVHQMTLKDSKFSQNLMSLTGTKMQHWLIHTGFLWNEKSKTSNIFIDLVEQKYSIEAQQVGRLACPHSLKVCGGPKPWQPGHYAFLSWNAWSQTIAPAALLHQRVRGMPCSWIHVHFMKFTL